MELTVLAQDLIVDPDDIAEQALAWCGTEPALREVLLSETTRLAMRIAAVKAAQLVMAETRRIATDLNDRKEATTS